MCGIAGIIYKQYKNVKQALLEKILLSQQSRGPDFTDLCSIENSENSILLGHNRLSITDLSFLANQPMWDLAKKYCITFNGEIYNFTRLRQTLKASGYDFATASDTEVILQAYAAWGVDAFQHLNGAFAFALYDSIKNKIILCRDRFGKKPLFYYYDGHDFFFASTGKMLAKHLNLRPNLQYLSRGLKFHIYEGDHSSCIYEKLNCLLPAHYLEISLAENIHLKMKRYYDLSTNVFTLREKIALYTQEDLIALLNDHIDNAIESRLKSDVPMAWSLSGGLDSSTIVNKVAKKMQDLNVFSFGHVNRRHTEAPLVKTLGDMHRLKVHFVWPEQNEFHQAFFDTLALQDAPFTGLSVVAQNLVFKSASKKGYKVLMGGQGGDEALMGYRKYVMFYLKSLYHQKKYSQSALYLLFLCQTLLAEHTRLGWFYKISQKFNQSNGLSHRLNIHSRQAIQLGYNPEYPLWQRQLADITCYSLPTLLRYEDSNALGYGVESRLPFTDYRLIEFGLALPIIFKIKKGYGKWIIRELMKNNLPSQIIQSRSKKGFAAEDDYWIKSGLGHKIRAYLQDHRPIIDNFLPKHTDLQHFFSDRQLLTRANAITEASTLIWLCQK